jgi:hypothetical protein
MKIIAPLLLLYSLVCLTSPDGFATWVEKNAVVSILRPAGDCHPWAKSKVTLSNGSTVCVQEDRKDVVKKIEDAK